MIQLVRNSIRPLLKHVADGYAGLLMQRGLVVWKGKETDGEKDKSDKLDLIDTITNVQSNDPDEKLRITIAALSESDLILGFSKDISKFFKSHQVDRDNKEDCQKIADIVYAEHADTINSWANDKAKNISRAYKFIINNKSI